MIQGYRDTENIDIGWIQLGIQRYSNKGIREYKGHSNIADTGIRLDTGIQGYMDTIGYRDTGIQRRQEFRRDTKGTGKHILQ